MHDHLTFEDRAFLAHHKIPMSALFDATGMGRAEYSAAMKREEKLFATGVSACSKGGHRMRERAGHCIQCDPKYIEFMRRHYKNGYVYVSASRLTALIKVGFSNDPDERERTLNSFSYGGANDWVRVSRVKCKNAGRVEFDVHLELSPFYSPQTYLHERVLRRCYEVFSCGYPTAREALKGALDETTFRALEERHDALVNYDFPDRKTSQS